MAKQWYIIHTYSGFEDRVKKTLEQRIEAALDKPPLGDPEQTMPEVLGTFTWDAVVRRIERVWLELIAARGS